MGKKITRRSIMRNLNRIQSENFRLQDAESNPKMRAMYKDIAMLAKCIIAIEKMIGGPGDDVEIPF